jgi:membrane associated rhomboid family serine protease
MAARVCPYCRELNGASEARCFRCGRRLPGPLSDGVFRAVRELLGADAPVTRLLLALELIVFALLVAADRRFPLGFNDPPFRASTLLRFGALGGASDVSERWRLLSAVFVHMSVLHVGMNLWMFTDLGARLERELGGARAALVFLVAGVLGFVASELWYAPLHLLTAGASGGVFGQIGAEVGILRARRDPEWRRSLARNVMYALLLSFALRVNTAAHLGGFAAGIALGFAFEKERTHLKLERLLRVVAGVMVLGAVLAVLLSTQSTAWQVKRAHELVYE